MRQLANIPLSSGGRDTSAFGGKRQAYPEEIFVVSGRLYDAAFGVWLEPGHYASCPPGEWAIPDGRGLRGVGGLVSQSNRWAPMNPREDPWNT